MNGYVGKNIVIDNVCTDRYSITMNGEIYDRKLKRYLYGHLNKGYMRVTLTTIEGGQRSYYIHVLVMCIYDSDMRDNMTVNHEDGDKLNNHYSNLKWMTYYDNLKHAIDTGLIKNKSHMSEDTVIAICELLERGETAESISDKFKLNKSTIYGIRTGINWKHISKDYEFIKRPEYKLLTDDVVEKLCEDISKGLNLREISRKHNVNYATLGSIKQKISWKHISSKYF